MTRVPGQVAKQHWKPTTHAFRRNWRGSKRNAASAFPHDRHCRYGPPAPQVRRQGLAAHRLTVPSYGSALMNPSSIDRRSFVARSVAGGAGLALAAAQVGASSEQKPRRIKVGVIGCGSVSHKYLPHLAACPFAELVSACDIIPERAEQQAAKYGIPNRYPLIDKLLAGAPFDLLVNLTDMQEHERLNRQAVEAGKHVWSEKPIAKIG